MSLSEPGLARSVFDWLGVLALGAVVLVSDALTGFIGGMRCDEGCTHNSGAGNPTGAPWDKVADAWQWDLITWLAGASALAVVVGLATFAGRASYPVSRIALIAAVAFAAVPWVLIVSNGVAGTS